MPGPIPGCRNAAVSKNKDSLAGKTPFSLSNWRNVYESGGALRGAYTSLGLEEDL